MLNYVGELDKNNCFQQFLLACWFNFLVWQTSLCKDSVAFFINKAWASFLFKDSRTGHLSQQAIDLHEKKQKYNSTTIEQKDHLHNQLIPVRNLTHYQFHIDF